MISLHIKLHTSRSLITNLIVKLILVSKRKAKLVKAHRVRELDFSTVNFNDR